MAHVVSDAAHLRSLCVVQMYPVLSGAKPLIAKMVGSDSALVRSNCLEKHKQTELS